jgi:hypothetical protein
VAGINATPEQKALRSVGRIKTLRLAIEKAQSRGQAERVASLTEELDRRLAEVEELKAALAEV